MSVSSATATPPSSSASSSSPASGVTPGSGASARAQVTLGDDGKFTFDVDLQGRRIEYHIMLCGMNIHKVALTLFLLGYAALPVASSLSSRSDPTDYTLLPVAMVGFLTMGFAFLLGVISLCLSTSPRVVKAD